MVSIGRKSRVSPNLSRARQCPATSLGTMSRPLGPQASLPSLGTHGRGRTCSPPMVSIHSGAQKPRSHSFSTTAFPSDAPYPVYHQILRLLLPKSHPLVSTPDPIPAQALSPCYPDHFSPPLTSLLPAVSLQSTLQPNGAFQVTMPLSCVKPFSRNPPPML